MGLVLQQSMEEGARQGAFGESLGDGGGIQHRRDVLIPREIEEPRTEVAQHRIEFGDFLFPQSTGELEVEDGVGWVQGFALRSQSADVVGMVQGEGHPNEADRTGGELFMAAGAVGIQFDPPGMAGVAASHRVRRMDPGHEVKWLAGGAGRGGRNMDVPEQPGMEAGVAEVAIGHVEIPLVGIEPEALDIAVGDADVEHVGLLFLIRHPADGVLLAMFAGAWAGIKADLEIVAIESLGVRLGQGKHAAAVRRSTELFPDFAIRSLAEVVIAGEDKDRLAFEFPEDSHHPLDLGFRDGGLVEQIARDDNEVCLAVVGGGHHPFE